MKLSSEDSSRKNILDKLIHKIESVKPSDKLILRIALFAVIFSGVWLVLSLNSQFSETTPTYGGVITEGILGTPRYINPALATTRADQDVTALVYSGLMKISPEGELVNDVADDITTSEDGLTYTVNLRRDIKFHDGTPLTARDVAYTINLIQNPDLKSPIRGNWTDVTVEEVDEYTLNIKLEEAYAPFIENFTVGILPAHAWSQLPVEQIPFSQLNTEPIGSGPFQVADTERDTAGLIRSYTLDAFPNYNQPTKLAEIELHFFEREELLINALVEDEIDATTYIPQAMINQLDLSNYELIEQPLPRTFAVFFNQNRSTALRSNAVREALSLAIDREMIINEALYGYGVPNVSPTTFIQPELKSVDSTSDTSTSTPVELAEELLIDDGWEKTELGLWEKEIDDETVTLRVTLRTSNTPLFDSMARLITESWESLGVEVATEQFEQAGLVQSVIRPRDFQALLFGHDMSRSYDLYPVWHSSQQNDPGLNIAQYANVSVDDLLEEARTTQDNQTRIDLLLEAGQTIGAENPAVFIAQPTLTYIVNSDINLSEMNQLGKPSDRFNNVANWHTRTDSLWQIFRNKDI